MPVIQITAIILSLLSSGLHVGTSVYQAVDMNYPCGMLSSTGMVGENFLKTAYQMDMAQEGYRPSESLRNL